MRLVFVESSGRAWGSEQHFVDLAKGCADEGYAVAAVVRAGSDVARLLKGSKVLVRETPFRGGADPRALAAIWRTVREIRATWLVTDHQKHYWPLFVLARLLGCRLAVFRHMAYIRSWLTRKIFPRLADRFFVVSDFAADALMKAGAPASRLCRLYNPIDLQRFRGNATQAARTRAALDLPDDAYVVGFVGRHELGKGVDVLRRALSLATQQDTRLHALWIGVGPQWQATQEAIACESDAHRHRFIDWTDRPEQYYVAMDCLVAPSQAVETFGRVVAEAQACGVPVIASTIGGLVEAFEPDRSGLAFNSDDHALLAEYVLALRRDVNRRAWMSRVGVDFVKQFATPCIVGLFLQALASVAPPRSLPPVKPAIRSQMQAVQQPENL